MGSLKVMNFYWLKTNLLIIMNMNIQCSMMKCILLEYYVFTNQNCDCFDFQKPKILIIENDR